MIRQLLILEDSVRYRNSIKAAFKNEPYSFLEASSVNEAVTLLQDNPDAKVIMLDLSLPGENGAELLERIKSRASYYRTIILTGHEELLAAEIARDYEVFNYLPKGKGLAVQ